MRVGFVGVGRIDTPRVGACQLGHAFQGVVAHVADGRAVQLVRSEANPKGANSNPGDVALAMLQGFIEGTIAGSVFLKGIVLALVVA